MRMEQSGLSHIFPVIGLDVIVSLLLNYLYDCSVRG